jgi:hypothetical protein
MRTRYHNGENLLHVGAGLLARPMALKTMINMIKQSRWFCTGSYDLEEG